MRSRPKIPANKSKSIKSKRAKMVMLVAIAVLAAGVVVGIALPNKSTQAAPKKYKATKEIILDPATGTRRKPTQDETDAMVRQIESLANRSTDGLTTTYTANGAKMDLQGRFGGVVLGRASADGGTEVRCVFTFEEAADFLGLEEDTQ